MASFVSMRFKQAHSLYTRHVQAQNIPARTINEQASVRTDGGSWTLHDERGPVARVRPNGTVLLMEGA